MGWKSTKYLTRAQAIASLNKYIPTLNDEELGDVMDRVFGDSTERPYHGHNFLISANGEDDDERALYERLKAKYE